MKDNKRENTETISKNGKRVVKSTKNKSKSGGNGSDNSKIFEKYRTIGVITNELGHSIEYLGQKGYITTSIGKRYQVYDLEKLRLVMVGPEYGKTEAESEQDEENKNGGMGVGGCDIDSFVSWGEHTIVSVGGRVYINKRGKLIEEAGNEEEEIEEEEEEEEEEQEEKETNSKKTKRGKKSNRKVGEFEYNSQGRGRVFELMVLGGVYLLGITELGNSIMVWNLETREKYREIQFSKREFIVKSMMHPSTYVDKIVVGSNNGQLKIINIRSGQAVGDIKSIGGVRVGSNVVQRGSSIECMEQTSALDIIGLGTLDGQVLVYDLARGRVLKRFAHSGDEDSGNGNGNGNGMMNGSADDRIKSISFGSDEYGHIMVTNTEQQLAIWDLNENKAIKIMRNERVDKVSVLSKGSDGGKSGGMLIVVSSGIGNFIKIYEFYGNNNVRLIKSIEGHSSYPRLVKFYSDTQLISYGQNSGFRVSSIIRDATTYRIHSGNGDRDTYGAESIEGFAINSRQENEWDNMVGYSKHTINTYSVGPHTHKRLGTTIKLSISNENNNNNNNNNNRRFGHLGDDEVTCCTISGCGNFGFYGTKYSEQVVMINLQSALKRKQFNIPKMNNNNKNNTGKQAVVNSGKSSVRVNSIQVDNCNTKLYVSSNDGYIHVFDIKTARLLASTMVVENKTVSIDRLVIHDNSNLLVGYSNSSNAGFPLYVYTTTTSTSTSTTGNGSELSLVRHIPNTHTNKLTDLAISRDGRVVITSSLDNTIRTWDIVGGGHLLDVLRVEDVCVALAMSADDAYLATCHAGSLGITLWANRTNFVTGYYAAPLNNIIGSNGLMSSSLSSLSSGNNVDTDCGLVLSTVHKSKWKQLLDLDLIKTRNKPVLPSSQNPENNENVPFFIPISAQNTTTTTTTTTTTSSSLFDPFNTNSNSNSNTNDNNTFITEKLVDDQSSLLPQNFTTTLSSLLNSTKTSNTELMDYLKPLTNSQLDFEVRCLNISEAKHFLSLLINMLSPSNQNVCDFDLINVYINLLLKIHFDTITPSNQPLSSTNNDVDIDIDIDVDIDINGNRNGNGNSYIDFAQCQKVLVDRYQKLDGLYRLVLSSLDFYLY